MNTDQFRQFARARHASGNTFGSGEVAALPPTHFSALLDEAANYQRGEPENVMVAAQRRLGGGLYSHALEHVGDLTHRIAEEGGAYGSEFVAPKVRQQLRSLTHPYGFAREMNEQIESNQKFMAERGGSAPDVEEVGRLGRAYAAAHQRVPVYTEPMMHGRQAAIAVGDQNFPAAVAHLNALQRDIDKGEEHWRARNSQPASVEFLRKEESY